jgi:hypothetical protein
MKQTLNPPVAFLLCCLLIGCGTSNKESQHSDQIREAKERIAMDTPPPLAPNHCKVIATIESIDKVTSNADEKDPCSKAPCMATMRIDSILGYGAAFPGVFSRGQKVAVKFAFTLSNTKEILPDVRPPLPGLNAGSIIEAVVNGVSVMGKSEASYTIYKYQKK